MSHTTAVPARSLSLAQTSSPGLEADGAFSYECRRCMRCCRDKHIRVNPYETCRLARSLGLDTTQFLNRHTTAQGTELARTDDGRGVFLGPEGCRVPRRSCMRPTSISTWWRRSAAPARPF